MRLVLLRVVGALTNSSPPTELAPISSPPRPSGHRFLQHSANAWFLASAGEGWLTHIDFFYEMTRAGADPFGKEVIPNLDDTDP